MNYKNAEVKKIKARSIGGELKHRFVTLQYMSQADYDALKRGETIEINKQILIKNKHILEEVN